MNTRWIEMCSVVAMAVVCLSAPVGLMVLGSNFRIAARMAGSDRTAPVVESDAPVPAMLVALAHRTEQVTRR